MHARGKIRARDGSALAEVAVDQLPPRRDHFELQNVVAQRIDVLKMLITRTM